MPPRAIHHRRAKRIVDKPSARFNFGRIKRKKSTEILNAQAMVAVQLSDLNHYY
jgi:hypothetical protein